MARVLGEMVFVCSGCHGRRFVIAKCDEVHQQEVIELMGRSRCRDCGAPYLCRHSEQQGDGK